MPALRDQGVHRAANFPKQWLPLEITTAISLTSAVVASITPGYRYQVVAIRSFCRTKAGTVTAVVKVGTRTAASIVFTAATDLAATLSTTLANLRGSTTEAITVELTTDGSGVLTNAKVTVVIRPWPLNSDVGST